MITVEHLTKSFTSRNGTVLALDDVTLDVAEGTLCGLVGPSGAGKSTLARCVTLQERPDRGTIRVGGTNLLALGNNQLRLLRRQIGVVPPENTLLTQRTVAGNIALPLEQAGVDGPHRRARVAELLDLAGLTERAATQPDELSAGARQRVAIARALASGPSVLLADEPTAGLDHGDTTAVLTVLDRARAELGVTVLLVTKDADVIRRVCDDVAVLDGGRLLERGKLLDLALDLDSWTASAILPPAHQAQPASIRAALSTPHDRVADVVLIGFASVGALLPEAGARFGVEVAVLGGGLTRLGDTPVARFSIGVSGDRADSALAWIADRGAVVQRTAVGPQGVAA
ncbi:MAG TPA: methionine ABC transporter ATP-binding protein [Pseudonocardiaceae bacterium]|jgi:D-methionine transport system ATP-binding protein|nr:methionine ABC transporter ATP-binding protein [Pseudonocardiaceae bacterium]